MDASTRKAELERLKASENNVAMTGIPLRYKGTVRTEKVYKIPLSYLIYNKYNGRIGAEVKSYERQNHVLNPENDSDKKIIGNFLYNSKKDKNDETMKSLLKNSQQRYGIVTADGVIVDGNRRAYLLNKLFHERSQLGYDYSTVENCQYFLAVILPEDATEKDIQQLETVYQMGEDDKLDYNPIEKYLKCSDLKQLGFSNDDISEFMNEKISQITKWLSVLNVMEDYLDTYDYQGIYTRLEKTEGPFVDLDGYLESYKKRGNNVQSVSWTYEDSDISDLKLVCFDYIRARYEGKEFREIAKTGVGGSIFGYKELWDAFLNDHRTRVPGDDLTPDDLRQQRPDEDLTTLYRLRDKEWSEKAKGPLEGNLRKFTGKLEDKRDGNQPLKLLEKALDALESVDTTQETFYSDPKVLECVSEINTAIWDMKKLLDRKRGHNGSNNH